MKKRKNEKKQLKPFFVEKAPIELENGQKIGQNEVLASDVLGFGDEANFERKTEFLGGREGLKGGFGGAMNGAGGNGKTGGLVLDFAENARKIGEIGEKSVGKINFFRIIFNFFEFILYFFVFFLLNNAKISGIIAPFGIGAAFGLALVGKNMIVFAPIYFVSGVLCNLSVEGLVCCGCVCAVLLAMQLFVVLSKKQIPRFSVPLFELFAMVGFVYFNLGSTGEIVGTIAMCVVAMLFSYISFVVIRAVLQRGRSGSFSLDEKICLAIVIMAMALGLDGLWIWKFSVKTIVVCFCMLCVGRVFGERSALFFCALCGFGLAFANNSLDSLAVFCSWAIATCALGKVNRYANVVAVILVDFLMGAYFDGYAVWGWPQIVDIAFAGLVFCLVPKRVFEKMERTVENCKASGGLLLLDQSKKEIGDKLIRTAKVFENMGETYKRMVVNGLGGEEFRNAAIAKDVILRLCRNCENFERCMRDRNMEKDIVDLARAGSQKTKASLVDISKNIAMFCTKTTSLLSCVNYAVLTRAKNEKLEQVENVGKEQVGDHLLGTSRLVLRIAEQLKQKGSISTGKSRELLEEFLLADVMARDVVVRTGDNLCEVYAIVRKSEDVGKLCGIVSKFFGLEMQEKEDFCQQSGYKMLKFVPKPKFELVFGTATVPKLGQNGDSYAIANLDDNKSMIALCDGMGSGDAAHSMSEEVVGLVENFYRAGFDSDLVLSSVSHLLAGSTKEVFSTLDVCVVDADNGNADIIKACAPPAILKRGETCRIIEGQSLPIGIVENVADMKKIALCEGDVLVFATDGVYDAFASDEEYCDFVNNAQTTNVNLFAEMLLEEARSRRMSEAEKTAPDDMTVLAIRVV